MATSTVTKRLSIATVGAALIALGIEGAAQAAVWTFEGMSTGNLDPISYGYAGLDWGDNFYGLNTDTPDYTGTGYDNGTVSGNYVAFNGIGFPATVEGASPFNLNSAYLTAAWRDDLSVTVEGLNNGSSLYSRTVSLDSTAPTLVDFDYLNIDELRFTSSQTDDVTGQFVIDNVNITTVPESSTLSSVLVLGALGVGSLLKRKKQQKVQVTGSTDC